MRKYISHSVEETEKIAQDFAKYLEPGDVIACRGTMGMGKTAFARGLVRGLQLKDQVSSPTFTIVQEYVKGVTPLYHFDMYRVHGFDELYSTGFFDYLDTPGILYIEWSENIQDSLPEQTIYLTISRIDDDTREITIEGEGF